MATNPFLIESGSFMPGIQALTRGIQVGQAKDERQANIQREEDRALKAQSDWEIATQENTPAAYAKFAVANPQFQQIASQQLGITNKQTEQAITNTALDVLAADTPEQMADIMGSLIPEVEKLGGVPTNIARNYQELQSDDPMVRQQALQDTKKFMAMWKPEVAQRYTAATTEKPKYTGVEIDSDSGTVIYTNTATGDVLTKPINEFSLGDMTPKDRREFEKETRSSVRSDIGRIKKTASEIASAKSKFDANIDAARNGNRIAIASTIMNLAKLNSPGVVTDADFANMAGQQDPLGFAVGILANTGADTDALLRGFDPTNPETFDADAVTEVADNLIAASVPTIMKDYDGLREKTRIAELPEKAINTLFAGSDVIEGLRAFSKPQVSVDQEALDWANANPNDPRAAKILQLQGQ